ncbi:hypothetical protein C9374_005781 [Naegleria lovaniensis]|uniref:Glycerol-3-phosphate dehydrogenase [NAD(+)] n=1 Tax=Naegleria lovaniensis TaxID=51637 RepID=A0AA88GJ92_NAELO|nr:uncharacterized protein C9374_005781 [Naegleria lovaniensis]KAG2381989.1 hypothetical protein C9374_005781 [Naegleria lovaniensis]
MTSHEQQQPIQSSSSLHKVESYSSVPFLLSESTHVPSSAETEAIIEKSQINELPVDTVLVLGAGNFGMALAYHLAHHLNDRITIYARDQRVVDCINHDKVNPKYLSQIKLPDNMIATREINSEILKQHTVLLFSIPTQHMRSVLKQFKELLLEAFSSSFKHLCIFANKGIESESLKLPYEIIEEEMGLDFADRCVFLSGPSFAIEICEKQPTCVTVASKNIECALWAQRVFHSPYFRVYTSDDPIGVEVCGALKNVIAIASGICTGVGFQMNTRAALLTRGLHEITRIGHVMGANPLTMSGLSGIGDLFLTCTSEKSRNFTVGFRLGKGEALENILSSLGSVAEGVPTTKAAYQLCQKLKLRCPIVNAIYGMLYEEKPVKQAVKELLEEETGTEFSLYKNNLY